MPLLMALREQGKSWCFARVYSMSDGPKIAERKRIWDHDMVFFPDEELSHVGDTVSGGAERSRDRQRLLCGTPIIETEDGRDAVPKCPMAVAKRGGFFSTDVSERTLLWHFKVLYDTDGELRENCKSRQEFLGFAKEVSRTGIRIYKNQMHSTLSGRKKEAVDGILKYFGYPVLTHINKRSEKYEEERDKAEKFLADHLGKLTKKRSVTVARAHDEDSWTVSEPDIVLQERPVFDTYRVSEFDAIAAFNSGVEEPEAPVESEDNAFKADILFKNNAAKHVYLNWVGEGVHETTSVMELARLDAYLYAWMEVIQELIEKGEVRKVGGLRNKRFTDRFNKYLPLAVEDILKVCRDTLKEVRLEELSKPYDYEKREQAIALRGRDDEGYISLRDSTNIVSEQEHRGDIFNRHGRRHTSAFVNPVNKLDYVAITPRFFKSHICCWIGDVLDCYVGRCTSAEVKYEPITYDDECKISVEAESDSDSDREFVETSDDYFD